jgi:flagellar assembly protein FliH
MGAGAAPGSGRADPMASQPQHFHPANRDHDPTEGWDPFAACGSPSEPAIDPVEAARVAAHAEGYAQGLADAAEQARLHAEARERDGHLVDSIGQALASRVDRDAIAEHLRQTVLKLVSKLVGEIGVDPALLAGRIEAATDLLVDTQESAILRVHPDDVALLDGHLPETVFAVGDAAVARGSFVLESASTIVEDGPALWLDQLAAAIDKVPVPTC